MPNIIETTDAAASTATTYNLQVGQTAQGAVTSFGDHDWYRVQLVAGQTYTFANVGTGGNLLLDPYLSLRNASGTVVASDDDEGPGATSSITFTATTTGAYYIDAGAFDDTGTGQYGISATLGSRAHYDFMMGAGVLMRRGDNNIVDSWATSPGAAVNVTWSVSSSNTTQTDALGNATAFIAPSTAQVAAVQAALAMYADVANISFTRVNPGGTSNDGTIRINAYNSTTDGAGAYAYFPGSTAAGDVAGDVNFNNVDVSTTSLPQGSYSFFTVLHELGHSLGLKHPGDYNAAPGVDIVYGTDAQFREDTHQYTVMSYFDESNTSGQDYQYPDTLLMFDILAIQQLYGVDSTTRAGDSIYGFGANTGAIYDFAANLDPFFCIWDGAGTDTINASQYAMAQRIDLRDGQFSNIGGFTGNVSIAIGAVIENAIGGSGNDALTGNSAANTLNGGSGADFMSGLGGNDQYIVDNTGDVITEAAGQGTADRIWTSVNYVLGAATQVEVFTTTNAAGTAALNLTGNGFAQTILGNAGVNVLNGGGGVDAMTGFGGNDQYIVDNAGDVVTEGAGQGTADRIWTSVNYALGAAAQVEVFTTTNAAGTGAIDLTGNGFAQAIHGNAGANVINGGAGADTMTGYGGNDQYVVDNAGDVVTEAAGQGTADRVYTSVNYVLGAAAQVELFTTTNAAGTAAINLTGNGLAQTILGNAGINVLNGGGGADAMTGYGGNDQYIVDKAGDVVTEGAGQGTADRIWTSVNYALGAAAQVEVLTTTNAAGTGAIDLTGNAFGQSIHGNAGANILNGSGGADTMTSYGGNDIFVFNTALGATNVDTITDFSAPADTVWLENAIFTGLAAGALAAGAFASNTTGLAAQADDRIIYNSTTGALFYDADGSGAAASIQFATLTANLTVTSADFFVV